MRPQLLLAGAAMAALLGGLAGWAPAFTLAAIALGGEYSIRLHGRHGLDGVAIIEAVALLATVELGLRSLEARSIARPEPRVREAAAGRRRVCNAAIARQKRSLGARGRVANKFGRADLKT